MTTGPAFRLTWQLLLSYQLGAGLVGACFYLAVTQRWLLWALLFGGYVLGGTVSTLDRAHKKAQS